MLSKMIKMMTVATFMVAAIIITAIPAFALTSDLQYNFRTENKDEFYNRGEMHLNFGGYIPDFLHDMYDFMPQPVHGSDFGSNIIVPTAPSQTPLTNAPRYAPVSGYIAAPIQMTGMATGGFGSQSASVLNDPNLNIASFPSYTPTDQLQYPITPISEVRNANGSIGTLIIPRIDLTVTAYDGDTYEAMKRGIGHISSTSAWNSNVGLLGHNRGPNDHFGRLKNLRQGDEMTYSTKLGTRVYVVQEVARISETDWSKFQYTTDNRLTLLTCVEDVPSQRIVVSAVEKR